MNYRTSTEPSSESGRFGDIGTNIPVKLTKEELTELSTVKPLLACIHVAAEWALIDVDPYALTPSRMGAPWDVCPFMRITSI